MSEKSTNERRVWPPSTVMNWPVVKLDSGPARKRTALPMSSGRPMR